MASSGHRPSASIHPETWKFRGERNTLDETFRRDRLADTGARIGPGPGGPRHPLAIFEQWRCPMATYIILTRLSPDAVTEPKFVEKLERKVADRIRKHCPEVRWISSYSVLGACDYVDIFEAPDSDTATKVALLIRSFGHGTTETWLATPWDRFVEIAKKAAG